MSRRTILACLCIVTAFQTLFGSDVVSGSAFFNFTAKQLKRLEFEAKSGNKAACVDLADFYMLAKNDFKSAARWWKVLADSGDVDGIYGVGYCLMRSGNFEAGRKWLLVAKERHSPHADGALKELSERERNDRRR